MTVYSTNPKTVRVPHQAKWVTLLEDRRCLAEKLYVFTDGSSLGGYGAVIVTRDRATKLAGHQAVTSTRNVGAELNGFLLGLENAPPNSEIVVVSDYLGVAAWMTGHWKIKDSEVRAKIERAMAIAEERDLLLSFIHHAGHQRDDSAFTWWNSVADRLCDGREEPGEIDLLSAVERLGELTDPG